MTQSDLLDALSKLKESRLLLSEVDASLEPFHEDVFRLTCSFVSASRSLGSQPDPVYDDGYTIICKVEAGDIECSVQVCPSENARIESLSDGDELELDLKVLGFDSLYQRVILGQVVGIPTSVEVELPVEPEDSVEPKEIATIAEEDEPTEVESEPKPVEVDAEPIVERAGQVEEGLPSEEISSSEMEELLQEERSLKRFHLCMKGCGYMLAFGLYGFGGLLFLAGITSLFDPSPPVFIFLFVGPILLGIGHVIWKSMRSEVFRTE